MTTQPTTPAADLTPEELEVIAEQNQRIEDAEYDLELAKHMWSGRSLKEIDGCLISAREQEQSAILNRGDVAGAQLARFALVRERTRALTYFASKAELLAAKHAAGVE